MANRIKYKNAELEVLIFWSCSNSCSTAPVARKARAFIGPRCRMKGSRICSFELPRQILNESSSFIGIAFPCWLKINTVRSNLVIVVAKMYSDGFSMVKRALGLFSKGPSKIGLMSKLFLACEHVVASVVFIATFPSR